MTLTEPSIAVDDDLKRKVLEILAENRVMAISTLRADGWPQSTMVGYINDDLNLYFAVARDSQKFANISRDRRVSIAIGRSSAAHIRGLSMAARATDVADIDEIVRVNGLIAERFPEQSVFAPREPSSVLMRATPEVVSLIDLDKTPDSPVLLKVTRETVVRLMRSR